MSKFLEKAHQKFLAKESKIHQESQTAFERNRDLQKHYRKYINYLLSQLKQKTYVITRNT